jgi:3-oxoacyl-[acyl-carrier-protein] synthase III
MANVAIQAVAYCLNYAHEMGALYGTTPMQERDSAQGREFSEKLGVAARNYDDTCAYAPNLAYIGNMTMGEFEQCARPFCDNLLPRAQRWGRYGEIMPEDEFLGLMQICDCFDLIRLEQTFADAVRRKLGEHPLVGEARIQKIQKGLALGEIERLVAEDHAIPLYFSGKLAGCCCSAHATDQNLHAHVMLENLASKAGATLSLMHLVRNAGMLPEQIDFVVECSEEAAGDMNQRGGGNMAKAIAESAGCVNASGFDVRGFCAGPVNALIAAAGMVASGIRKNVAVVSGGAVAKLYMNAREHLKKEVAPLENCLGNFAALVVPQDGVTPEMRLDAIGKHSVAAGASPQAITTALVYEPLAAAGLAFADVDKYAPELHIADITLPAGAGNVPEANYKMIAALAVLKGQLERNEINEFVAKHGLPGFAHTQGHIPSGVPFIGHAVDAIRAGEMTRTMIIGKGSLFLGRLTNLADGASFMIEKPKAPEAPVSTAAVKDALLSVLEEMANALDKDSGGAKP